MVWVALVKALTFVFSSVIWEERACCMREERSEGYGMCLTHFSGDSSCYSHILVSAGTDGIFEGVAHHPTHIWGSRLILATDPTPSSLTLSVLPLGPQPPVPEKRPPEVQHFRMSDDMHSLRKVTSGQSHLPPSWSLMWPVLRI